MADDGHHCGGHCAAVVSIFFTLLIPYCTALLTLVIKYTSFMTYIPNVCGYCALTY